MLRVFNKCTAALTSILYAHLLLHVIGNLSRYETFIYQFFFRNATYAVLLEFILLAVTVG